MAIAAVIPDPINMAFDGKGNRLLLIDSATDELIEIDARPDGSPDPAGLTRHDAQRFGLINPQGMTVDPASGHLFILDSSGPRLVRVEPDPDQGFDTAVTSAVDLRPAGLVDVRGLALDPTTGHLHLFSPAGQALVELTQNGQPVATRDLSGLELGNPQGMVFAPSGDLTDDPLRMNLYLADSGLGIGPGQAATSLESGQPDPDGNQTHPPPAIGGSADVGGNAGRQAPGKLIELSFVEPVQPIRVAEADFISTLVQTTDTWQWSPPSPDSSGVAYLPLSETLLVADSEVNELPIFSGDNLFESTLSGILVDTFTTISYSDEPSGADIDPQNGHLFTADDTGARSIYELNPGSDGLYNTSDDSVTSFKTSDFGCSDPEGVAYDSSGQGVLYIADGVNREVYIVTPGPNGLFDGVDDAVTNFDTSSLGLENPEGIAFNPDTGHLYLVGKPVNRLFEVTTGGNLVQMIDISAANALNPGGLAYAPSSENSTQMNIYIVDRRVDNIINPDENDGMMHEMTLPPPPGGPVPPVANDDSASTTQDTPVTINVAANDADLNGNQVPASANTTCANGSNGCADPVNGSLLNNGDGTFTYTPDPGYVGPDSFVYEICDTDVLCDTATVTITVFWQQTLYVSTSSDGNAGGVAFNDEDILALDLRTGTWSLYFDGSDVGLNAVGQDIDAFHINADGSILLSLGQADTLPDLGAIENSDIVRFFPTSTGTNTAGIYQWYFDGSDVGLLDDDEDIDAVGIAPDGRLIISTIGGYAVSGVTGSDADLLSFTATSLGQTTSGSWELYFDGSDVGLDTTSAEDVKGAWMDDNGDIYLTTLGDFAVTGVAGDASDIFTCVPSSTGVNTSCTFSPSWDGSANGLAHYIVNGFAFEAPPGLPNQAPAVHAGSDQAIMWPPLAVFLDGMVIDDGLPGPLTTTWSRVSGPGTVFFVDAHAVDTTASFSEAGIYVLRLTADDGELAGSDQVTIILIEPVMVPNVAGLPEADAEAAIVAAGLTVGRVTTANSTSVPAGNVISQDPAANTPVLPGSAVDLVVSLGSVPVFLPLISN